ncbi:MAG TPA: hypothetical protein PLU67_06905 [Candidatus Kapabacteria bacterium]|jgi:hypothetical protein|nr:hypothetical protein [Candidatus Kapabacteria bacterium]HOM05203.1 hypothetical protein [Candidatus Kapabacteria bacterium]HOQ48581.1 hypothetical protein [Candidatus Kapabacteria bacterium]HPP39005.1 hypothetical protein [Candidatus Kapabacteria bacterium]HPU22647.1 hypothetical protein [Candidatus Kapabacteria bacterium]
MKVFFNIIVAFVAAAMIISCGNQKTEETAEKAEQTGDTSIYKSFFYLTYSGTITDYGEISSEKTNKEYHIFTLNSDDDNYAFLISNDNFLKWSSEKIIPRNLTDGETYVAEIVDGKEIQTDDKSVTYYLITNLKSMKFADDISTPGELPQIQNSN